jgi:hypothetical protein
MDKFLNTFWLEQDEPGRAGYGSGRVMGAHSIEYLIKSQCSVRRCLHAAGLSGGVRR